MARFGKKAEIGNPQGVTYKNATEGQYTIELHRGDHHLTHPEYSGFSSKTGDDNEATTCTYNGKVVLKFSMSLHGAGG
jgi:hypothetical protein